MWLYLAAQSYLTLYDPMDCSPPGSSVHGYSPSKNTGVGCRDLRQGILPTQGSNLYLLLSSIVAGGFFTTSAIWEAQPAQFALLNSTSAVSP